MFNLDEQMDAWRQSLLSRDVVGAADVDELEDHLRQEVQHLSRLGLSDQECFLVATQRLGAVGALDAEFSKVGGPVPFLRRLQWMLIGYFSVSIFCLSLDVGLGSLSSVMMTTGVAPGWTLYYSGAGLMLAAAVLWAIAACGGTISGALPQLVTHADEYLSRRFAGAIVALVVTQFLLGLLNGYVAHHVFSSFAVHHQMQQLHAASDYYNKLYLVSRLCTCGLFIGLALVTGASRRRDHRGSLAQ